MIELTSREALALQLTERCMSILSLLGSFVIILTFCREYFRKPINRLIFYASFGNMLASVATLISTSSIRPTIIPGLCLLQGILIQWFFMADACWVFSMALNVYLVFFRSYETKKLRHLEKWYLLVNYGVPGIPSIVYIVNDLRHSKKIIGPATIWCWVSADAEWMRIAFFYAPVWIIICATLGLYIAIGRRILRQNAEFISVSKHTASHGPATISLFTSENTKDIKVETEMKVETRAQPGHDSETPPLSSTSDCRSSFSSTRELSQIQSPVSTTAGPSSFSRVAWMPSLSRGLADSRPRRPEDLNTGYKATVVALNQVEDPGVTQRLPTSNGLPHSPRRRTSPKAIASNRAAWSYFKVAFLMFTALIIVWVPSTVNRLQQFTHKDKPVFGLNLASALVLPLQGFWNAVIYISTSWPECKRAITETMDHFRGRKALNTIDKHLSLTDESLDCEQEISLSEMLK
ncbi:hypothetical protein BDV95DRAFT_165997 [Massariosphaeria phaeospora]|uniref:G-protein coupled receptors family 2 profile 2 domain-containing protein n=1 Tax=Massariosphaeria phaeospora TaxID=100035 RepID=A0A7C8MII1_9PLEO|nr:hypothetical protein BDV95DRAFT_165997 [Massariosphaeria phaeospora]